MGPRSRVRSLGAVRFFALRRGLFLGAAFFFFAAVRFDVLRFRMTVFFRATFLTVRFLAVFFATRLVVFLVFLRTADFFAVRFLAVVMRATPSGSGCEDTTSGLLHVASGLVTAAPNRSQEG